MNDELKRSTRSKARSLANIVSIQHRSGRKHGSAQTLIRLQIKELCKEISLPDYFHIVDFNLVWRFNMRNAGLHNAWQCHAIGENEKRRKSGSNEVQNMIINGPNDSISKISMQKKVVRESAVAIKLIYSIRYTITIYRYTIKQLNILIISKNQYIYFWFYKWWKLRQKIVDIEQLELVWIVDDS